MSTPDRDSTPRPDRLPSPLRSLWPAGAAAGFLLGLAAGGLAPGASGSQSDAPADGQPTGQGPAAEHAGVPAAPAHADHPLQLGNFSVSLAVEDMAASRDFYEKLGFHTFAGSADQNWLIMQNQTSTIGLFHGFFEGNILTFNPGWDSNAQTLDEFDDVRDIQRTLRERGIEPILPTDPDATGPANIMLEDPDGNRILIDQHVPRTER